MDFCRLMKKMKERVTVGEIVRNLNKENFGLENYRGNVGTLNDVIIVSTLGQLNL